MLLLVWTALPSWHGAEVKGLGMSISSTVLSATKVVAYIPSVATVALRQRPYSGRTSDYRSEDVDYLGSLGSRLLNSFPITHVFPLLRRLRHFGSQLAVLYLRIGLQRNLATDTTLGRWSGNPNV